MHHTEMSKCLTPQGSTPHSAGRVRSRPETSSLTTIKRSPDDRGAHSLRYAPHTRLPRHEDIVGGDSAGIRQLSTSGQQTLTSKFLQPHQASKKCGAAQEKRFHIRLDMAARKEKGPQPRTLVGVEMATNPGVYINSNNSCDHTPQKGCDYVTRETPHQAGRSCKQSCLRPPTQVLPRFAKTL